MVPLSVDNFAERRFRDRASFDVFDRRRGHHGAAIDRWTVGGSKERNLDACQVCGRKALTECTDCLWHLLPLMGSVGVLFFTKLRNQVFHAPNMTRASSLTKYVDVGGQGHLSLLVSLSF